MKDLLAYKIVFFIKIRPVDFPDMGWEWGAGNEILYWLMCIKCVDVCCRGRGGEHCNIAVYEVYEAASRHLLPHLLHLPSAGDLVENSAK